MPTDKLGLPTITGNMTADVVRDINAIAQAVDDRAGIPDGLARLGPDGKLLPNQENVVAPPDASTITKGIVQLDDSIDSTSTTKAATPNAVKKANDNANTRILKSVIDKPGGVPSLDSSGRLPIERTPIYLKPSTSPITLSTNVGGVNLPSNVSSGDMIRWLVDTPGIVRVMWKVTTNNNTSSITINSWVEVNGVRYGDEKATSPGAVNTQLSQEIPIKVGDKVSLRVRHNFSSNITLGLSDVYIGGGLFDFLREV